MIEKKNYYGIDLLKFIMAVCVVAIHTQPLYSVQSIVVQRLFDTITSLAVPYFFSVSGFLLFSKIDADISCRKNMEVCKRYLSRVLSLYVIWNIIYGIVNGTVVYRFIIRCQRQQRSGSDEVHHVQHRSKERPGGKATAGAY